MKPRTRSLARDGRGVCNRGARTCRVARVRAARLGYERRGRPEREPINQLEIFTGGFRQSSVERGEVVKHSNGASAAAPAEPLARDGAPAWELLADVLDGKLSVQQLSQLSRMRLDDVHAWLRQRQRSAIVAFEEHMRQALVRQGAAVEALAGPELSASLTDVSMIDWIQAIQILARQAVITVLHGTFESRIWCADGAIVDAVSGRLRGEAAVYRIAALDSGQVVTELRAVHRERTIQTATPWMLLEAARRKDHASRIRLELGDLARPFQCAVGGASSRSLNSAEAAVLTIFDQPRQLAEVLAQSELGEVETLAALLGLIRSRHLVESAMGERIRRTAARALPAPDASALPIPFRWPRSAERPTRPVWLGSTLLLGLVVALGSWLGARASRTTATDVPAVSLPAERLAYAVAIRPWPPDAELELDAQPLGRGAWAASLPRDGRAHELSISAPGFISTRVFFLDVAPPTDIRLAPLPESWAPPLPMPASAEAEVAPGLVRASARARSAKRKALGSSGADTKASSVAPPALEAPDLRRASATEQPASASTPRRAVPYVQVIEAEARSK